MKQPRDQHWERLLVALEDEADEMKGTGSSTICVRFHQGQPREIEVLERKQKYLIARGGAAKQER